jgi:hypothetical protein
MRYMSKSHPEESKMPATLTPVPAEFATSQPMATPKQMDWILKCRDDKMLTDEQIAWLDAEIAKGVTKARASKILDRLFALPSKPVERATTVRDIVAQTNPFKIPDIPSGRYALRGENILNNIEFYSVYRFEDGGLSLKRFASDERYPVKGAARQSVLKAIAADITGAAQLYGTETNHCGRCAKLLTRRVSRDFGLGAKCAEHMGVSAAYEALAASLTAQGIDPNETIEEES